MPVDISRTLRVALVALQQDKQRLDRQIAAIETALSGDAGRPRTTRTAGVRRGGVRRRRRRMSAIARRAVGKRMKAYWANRRAAAAARTPRAATTSRQPKRK